MTTREYDVIVIGAGPVGENVADRVVQGGLTAVIVESELVGGECSYWACMPSKALLRPGAALSAARAVRGARAAASGTLDVAGVLARRDAFTHDWNDASQVEWLDGAGIDLVRGHARITGERRVDVTGGDGDVTTLVARRAVAVCTGSDAAIPRDLAPAAPWTSREATSAAEVPASLLIVGGGVVGVEMATVFASLGSEVTVIARSGLLSGMEPFAGDAVTDALRARGVPVRTDTGVVAAARTEDGISVTLDDGSVLHASELLAATGRAPRTQDLGLDTVGLTPGEWLHVDDTLRVQGSDWLYGVGDVNHRALLTHQGKYQARAAGDAIVARATAADLDTHTWGAHVATADHAAVPQVVFTDPPVSSIGRTAAAAREAGMRVRIVDQDLSAIAGAAAFADGYRGTARAVVDEDRGVLVGATFVGAGTEELLHSATIAIVGEVPLARLWHAVPSYPTISEVWLRWLESIGRASA